jgi:hypothetical protein
MENWGQEHHTEFWKGNFFGKHHRKDENETRV